MVAPIAKSRVKPARQQHPRRRRRHGVQPRRRACAPPRPVDLCRLRLRQRLSVAVPGHLGLNDRGGRAPADQSLQVFGTMSSGATPACNAWMASPRPGRVVGIVGSCAKLLTPPPNAPGKGWLLANTDRLSPTQAWLFGSAAPAIPTPPPSTPNANTTDPKAIMRFMVPTLRSLVGQDRREAEGGDSPASRPAPACSHPRPCHRNARGGVWQIERFPKMVADVAKGQVKGRRQRPRGRRRRGPQPGGRARPAPGAVDLRRVTRGLVRGLNGCAFAQDTTGAHSA